MTGKPATGSWSNTWTHVRLTVLGRLSARAEIIRNLQTRLRLADYWRAHPDVFDEEIVEPVFIVGPPRTGTSILLELLARDPGLRPVVAHEAHFPLDRSRCGPTASEVSEPEQEFWADIHPDFQAMHELRSDLPCECVHFVQPEFRSWHWSMMFDLNDVPGRTTPEANQAIYRFHRQFLQTLQHRDGHRSRFLLKTPAHLGFLPELFETYPDALVIFTHRDPLKFIGSSANLTGVLHWMRSDDVDLSIRGPIMAAVYEILLGGAMQQRIAGEVPAEQITTSISERSWPTRSPRSKRPMPRSACPSTNRCGRRFRRISSPNPKESSAFIATTPLASASTSRACERSSSDYIEHYGVELEHT